MVLIIQVQSTSILTDKGDQIFQTLGLIPPIVLRLTALSLIVPGPFTKQLVFVGNARAAKRAR